MQKHSMAKSPICVQRAYYYPLDTSYIGLRTRRIFRERYEANNEGLLFVYEIFDLNFILTAC